MRIVFQWEEMALYDIKIKTIYDVEKVEMVKIYF